MWPDEAKLRGMSPPVWNIVLQKNAVKDGTNIFWVPKSQGWQLLGHVSPKAPGLPEIRHCGHICSYRPLVWPRAEAHRLPSRPTGCLPWLHLALLWHSVKAPDEREQGLRQGGG